MFMLLSFPSRSCSYRKCDFFENIEAQCGMPCSIDLLASTSSRRLVLSGRSQLFGAEPPLKLNSEELREFDDFAAARLKVTIFAALKAFVILAINILCIVPFSAGHWLHSHWGVAKFLVFSAMVCAQDGQRLGVLAERPRDKTRIRHRQLVLRLSDCRSACCDA